MKSRFGRAGYAIAGLVTVLALGCGGQGPAENNGSILVASTPTTLAVVRGSGYAGEVTAWVTRRGGFSGTVTLAISGLPSGVIATITPAELLGTTGSATITVIAAPNATAGPATVTITATAQGVAQATATYQLVVTDGW